METLSLLKPPERTPQNHVHGIDRMRAGFVCPCGHGAGAEDNAKTMELLQHRKQQQEEAAKQFHAFYDFHFTNRVRKSRHHVLEAIS